MLRHGNEFDFKRSTTYTAVPASTSRSVLDSTSPPRVIQGFFLQRRVSASVHRKRSIAQVYGSARGDSAHEQHDPRGTSRANSVSILRSGMTRSTPSSSDFGNYMPRRWTTDVVARRSAIMFIDSAENHPGDGGEDARSCSRRVKLRDQGEFGSQEMIVIW